MLSPHGRLRALMLGRVAPHGLGGGVLPTADDDSHLVAGVGGVVAAERGGSVEGDDRCPVLCRDGRTRVPRVIGLLHSVAATYNALATVGALNWCVVANESHLEKAEKFNNLKEEVDTRQ